MWYFVGLIGLGIGLGGLYMIIYAFRSRNWSTTKGTVHISEIRKWEAKPGGTQHQAKVTYTYRVDGVHYESSQISHSGNPSGIKWLASRIVNRYPVGKEVTVYYNPKNPEKAVLELHSFSWIGVLCTIIGTVIVCLSAFGILYWSV